MPNWEEIQKEWETTKITLAALAEKHDVKLGTLKSRKSREAWVRGPSVKDATIQKDATPKDEKVATKEGADKPTDSKRYPNGHPGNKSPVKKFTERNQTALKHGLFSRYMPKETLEIMGMVAGSDPADLIWMQVELQFATIIRAQQIMFVEDKDDMAKEKSQVGWGDSGADKYEIQFAWDRQAVFMNAQTKAISELRASIKQFMELADSADERRYKLELMQQQIEKLKREGNPDTSKEDKLKEYFTALGGAFRDN